MLPLYGESVTARRALCRARGEGPYEGKVLRYVGNIDEDGVCRVRLPKWMGMIRCSK